MQWRGKKKNIIEHLWRLSTGEKIQKKKNKIEIKNILCVYTQLTVTGYRFEEEKLKIGQTKKKL